MKALLTTVSASILVLPLQLYSAPSPYLKAGTGHYSVSELGRDHRVWQRVETRTNQLGQVQTITNSYVELETGMNYWSDGRWQPSEAKIEITADGASANKGRHAVSFAGNINTAGVISLTTPSGDKMRSHVLGLSYYDSATGQSALIAEINDSIGVLTPPNQVIYPDAFTDFKADLRYTYTKAGFEQDVILREQLPSPAEYGLNADSTRLEILTEFIEAPVPKIIKKALNDGIQDEELHFGSMSMGPGIAFFIGDGGAATNNPAEIQNGGQQMPVSKEWIQMEGRTFLIESTADQ